VAKPNYHHARRQKELVRKTRQQEKQQKRAASKGEGEGEGATGADTILAGDPAAADAATVDSVGAVRPNIGE
jgi:hypothetical protein